VGGEILLHSRASWHLNICALGSFTPAKSPTTNHSVFRMEATQGQGRWIDALARRSPAARTSNGPKELDRPRRRAKAKGKLLCSPCEQDESGHNKDSLHHSAQCTCPAVLQSATCMTAAALQRRGRCALQGGLVLLLLPLSRDLDEVGIDRDQSFFNISVDRCPEM